MLALLIILWCQHETLKEEDDIFQVDVHTPVLDNTEFSAEQSRSPSAAQNDYGRLSTSIAAAGTTYQSAHVSDTPHATYARVPIDSDSTDVYQIVHPSSHDEEYQVVHHDDPIKK